MEAAPIQDLVAAVPQGATRPPDGEEIGKEGWRVLAVLQAKGYPGVDDPAELIRNYLLFISHNGDLFFGTDHGANSWKTWMPAILAHAELHYDIGNERARYRQLLEDAALWDKSSDAPGWDPRRAADLLARVLIVRRDTGFLEFLKVAGKDETLPAKAREYAAHLLSDEARGRLEQERSEFERTLEIMRDRKAKGEPLFDRPKKPTHP